MSAQQPAKPELDDIQGLVRFGYKHHTEACFLLLRVSDANAARAWLAAAPVASAVTADPLPETVLHVALTSAGLGALGVPQDIVNGFSADFVTGLGDDANRSRRLGDVGVNDPAYWRWGAGANVPHALVMLYALPGRLAAFRQSVLAQCGAGFGLMADLATANMHGVEPFGFMDGISQPQLDWDRERPAQDEEQSAYGNLSCLGEYLLGYPNEYGGYTERPLLDPQRDAQAQNLPRAEDAPDKADLGRNGSYLVMRQLRQDVAGFWKFADKQAGGDAAQREQIAAAMVGRKRDGEPLAAMGEGADEPGGQKKAVDLNAFDYRPDPRGLRCPLGAHVRRANPRNADLPPSDDDGPLSWLKRTLGLDADARSQDLAASTRFHRLLRRGREYGVGMTPEQALGTEASNAADTGLHFMCLNANIARQFEFVQGAWMAGGHFNGLHDESDPLLGSREPTPQGLPTDGFSMPQAQGPGRCLAGLPRFVTVVGGAYFFLPGLRALRYLAGAR